MTLARILAGNIKMESLSKLHVSVKYSSPNVTFITKRNGGTPPLIQWAGAVSLKQCRRKG